MTGPEPEDPAEPPHATLPPLPCIVCDRELDPVGPAAAFGRTAEPGQPYDAVVFSSPGQYGSTVFDPQDESRLMINVCDPCLIAKAKQVWHYQYMRRPALTMFSRPWDPRRATTEEEEADAGDREGGPGGPRPTT